MSTSLDLEFWHSRYLEQAGWSEQVRARLLDRMGFRSGSVLEVGCGTGAVMTSIRTAHPDSPVFGIDLAFSSLLFHQQKTREGSQRLICADGYALPLPDRVFDLVYCHYLLLWVRRMEPLIGEMIRVLKPGGILAVFAEPDYQARIDFPPAAVERGKLQNESLIQQGARLDTGRRIGPLIIQAGLKEVIYGVMGGEWTGNQVSNLIERKVLEDDLNRLAAGAPPGNFATPEWMFIPTFYAAGKKSLEF